MACQAGLLRKPPALGPAVAATLTLAHMCVQSPGSTTIHLHHVCAATSSAAGSAYSSAICCCCSLNVVSGQLSRRVESRLHTSCGSCSTYRQQTVQHAYTTADAGAHMHMHMGQGVVATETCAQSDVHNMPFHGTWYIPLIAMKHCVRSALKAMASHTMHVLAHVESPGGSECCTHTQ